MPFKSKAQERYLYSQKPDVAKEFAEKTTKKQQAKMPEKAPGKTPLKKIAKMKE